MSLPIVVSSLLKGRLQLASSLPPSYFHNDYNICHKRKWKEKRKRLREWRLMQDNLKRKHRYRANDSKERNSYFHKKSQKRPDLFKEIPECCTCMAFGRLGQRYCAHENRQEPWLAARGVSWGYQQSPNGKDSYNAGQCPPNDHPKASVSGSVRHCW